jgi:hypothetical protein
VWDLILKILGDSLYKRKHICSYLAFGFTKQYQNIKALINQLNKVKHNKFEEGSNASAVVASTMPPFLVLNYSK